MVSNVAIPTKAKQFAFVLLFYSKNASICIMSSRQQFLLEHNKLSPPNLQVTSEILSKFRLEKANLFKGSGWPTEKLRRPFIMWLTSLSTAERDDMQKNQKH